MKRSGMPVRIALLALSLAAIAWLGVSWSNARVADDVQAVLELDEPPPAQVDQALADVERIDRLNPDRSQPLAMRAVLHLRAGELDRAVADVEELVRIEPENAQAWELLAAFTQESDPERSAAARERVRELSPIDPR